MKDSASIARGSCARFDRSRRIWVRENCRTPQRAIDLALQAVRALEIPHLEWDDEVGQVVH